MAGATGAGSGFAGTAGTGKGLAGATGAGSGFAGTAGTGKGMAGATGAGSGFAETAEAGKDLAGATGSGSDFAGMAASFSAPSVCAAGFAGVDCCGEICAAGAGITGAVCKVDLLSVSSAAQLAVGASNNIEQKEAKYSLVVIFKISP